MKIKPFTLNGINKHGVNTSFDLVMFLLCREHDTAMEQIWQKGNELAQNVNPAAANQGDMTRSVERILNNCVSGLLAEYCWRFYINHLAKKEVLAESEFTTSSGQIDLLIKGTDKLIEIRSSFPRNGIEFAVFHPKYQFDILGPYSNTVKPSEIQKDYYLRTLYPFDAKDFFKQFNSSIGVYLSGGATWSMMNNEKYYTNKDLIAENDIVDYQRRSTYRVIPLSIALDTTDVTGLILNDCP